MIRDGGLGNTLAVKTIDSNTQCIIQSSLYNMHARAYTELDGLTKEICHSVDS